MRRGAVNSAAKKLGCSSVALAHHKDDVIETVLMSLFYEGRMNCFTPKTWLDKKAIKVIRPLIYVRESEIKMYSELAGLPIIHNPCPMDKSSRRSEVKDLLLKMESKNKYLKANIFGAVKRSLWT
jgi:tRNA(Ile)-lysidine synthase TilS/MesJ